MILTCTKPCASRAGRLTLQIVASLIPFQTLSYMYHHSRRTRNSPAELSRLVKSQGEPGVEAYNRGSLADVGELLKAGNWTDYEAGPGNKKVRGVSEPQS